jgi:hypothetical protein
VQRGEVTGTATTSSLIKVRQGTPVELVFDRQAMMQWTFVSTSGRRSSALFPVGPVSETIEV